MNTQTLMRGAEAYTSHAEVADVAYSEGPAALGPWTIAVLVSAGIYTSGVTVGTSIESVAHGC